MFSLTGEQRKNGVPQGSVPWPLLFIIYLIYLPLWINSVSESVLFAADTSVIISSRNIKDFCWLSKLFLSHTIKWLDANNLVLNFQKMNKMKFMTMNSSHCSLHTDYKEKHIQETANRKFLKVICSFLGNSPVSEF